MAGWNMSSTQEAEVEQKAALLSADFIAGDTSGHSVLDDHFMHNYRRVLAAHEVGSRYPVVARD
jgi:hypothetical protein